MVFASDGVDQYGSVSLQMIKIIPEGSHNVTISITGTYASNVISESTLLVQTLIP